MLTLTVYYFTQLLLGREINRQKETANDKKEVASSDDVEIVSKKDKNVKKEVRKNAKQDAKAKIASETRRETRSDTVRDPNNSRWTIKVWAIIAFIIGLGQQRFSKRSVIRTMQQARVGKIHCSRCVLTGI